jgi:hypothetical protein
MLNEGELLEVFRETVRAMGLSRKVSLSLLEAAKKVGLPERALRGLIRQGRVLAHRREGSLRVSLDEVRRLTASMGGPENGRPRVSAKARARLKAASLKRRNPKR